MAEPRSPAEVLIVGGGVAALETLSAFDAAVTFTGPGSAAAMRTLLDDLEEGRARRIAFVSPTVAGWTLPLYELALLTARHAQTSGLGCELALVTPEPRPLALFGERVSAVVAEMLLSGRRLSAARLVALPLVRGPQVGGVLSEPDFGFIPVDRVDGLDGVYASGDATNFPVKQRGLAAQQADAVAEHVAARHGTRLDPSPFHTVQRGMLFAGGADHHLRACDDAVAAEALWWPPSKIVARYLAPYVYQREPAAAPGPAPAGFVDLEVPLETIDAAPVGR